jgi:hypothetical protein
MQPPKYFCKGVTPTLVAGRPHSLWYLAGNPGAGAADTTTNGGVSRSSSSSLVTGQIPFYDPSVSINAYLARLQAQASIAGTLLLCDRLWDCGNANGSTLSPTSTSSQTINSATWPARDADGATLGRDVQIGVEVSTALGAGTPTWTMTYTNYANVGSRTATNIDSVVASSAIGAFYRMGMQAGDVGVRSIQAFQSNATSTSGQFVLVAYRVLASLELTGGNVPNAIDLLTGGRPYMPNGCVPFLIFVPSTTTASNISGQLIQTNCAP